MKITGIVAAIAALFLLLVLGGAFYTVRETEVVILTQFNRPVGDPITEPGLHWKTPFVQEVNRLEKRVLEFDGPPTRMTTKEKTSIEVDTFARWRISDPATFFVVVRDERSAQSRLEDIIGSETRASVASSDVIEIVRADKSRSATVDPQAPANTSSTLKKANRGRLEIEEEIKQASAPKLLPLGIELLDVRIKRVAYTADVLGDIHKRMISERAQIAQRFRSEGEGEAARILGRKERELRDIESVAYRSVQEIRGEADAEAARIYAEAYDQSPESRDFYTFLKTLETYRAVLGRDTNLILSTDSELFRLLHQIGK